VSYQFIDKLSNVRKIPTDSNVIARASGIKEEPPDDSGSAYSQKEFQETTCHEISRLERRMHGTAGREGSFPVENKWLGKEISSGWK
jgi:hypothetical protein